jgi:hypothetical protein
MFAKQTNNLNAARREALRAGWRALRYFFFGGSFLSPQ